jgi:CAAX prenyl protease-like protein
MDTPSPEKPTAAAPAGAPAGWRHQYPWIVYVLPLAVFMLVGAFEPKPEPPAKPAFWSLPYSAYPAVYTLKIVLTAGAIALVWPGYRQFGRRLSPLGLAVGVVGAALWIGLWKLGLERQLVAAVGPDSTIGSLLGSGTRSAFNPLEQMADRPALAYAFLAVRLFGLVLVIAVAEEFFLRGFLMRFVMQQDWWNVPFGQANATAMLVGTIVPMLMHPAELLAAAVWFSMVTWLMLRTRSIWDCVLAHATTNLLLGLYVLWAGGDAWELL